MLITALVFVLLPSVMVLTFSTYVSIGRELTPRRVFTVLSLASALRFSSLALSFRALFLLNEGSVAVKRITVGRSFYFTNLKACMTGWLRHVT